jgi:xylulokinase
LDRLNGTSAFKYRTKENKYLKSATYLTFDLGTTGLKTALVNDDGRVQAVYTVEYTPKAPHPGWAEMDPDTYWQAAVAGARAVLTATGADPSSIQAIGFSSQGQTFIPLDRAGRPLHDFIVWVDDRAQAIADEWAASWLSRDQFRRSSGYPWIPAVLTVFKAAWLVRHHPEIKQAWKFLCLPDYFVFRLTGETATDYVIARMGGFFNLGHNNWDPQLMEAAGIREEQLPRVLAPGQVAGRLQEKAARELGLPAGVPVCVGANDQLAGAVGAGNVSPGIVTETTGSVLALIATTPALLDDTNTVVGQHAVPELSYAMSFANTAAVVLKWFRDLCEPGADYDKFLAGVETVPPGCDGLTLLPHFAGTNMPPFNPNVRGAFIGLTVGHTRMHLARAIMEGCGNLLQECLEPMRHHDVTMTTVRSLGGAAHSDVWLQMKADLLGVPVERPACAEAASLGAAMLAAAGIGRFAGVREASEAWYRPERVFEPNASRYAVYREVYERYQQLQEKLYGDATSKAQSRPGGKSV